jgi:peptidoglycan hydrolase-like protein with peptidoglycan-binding domain
VDADNRRPGTLDTAAAAKYQPAGTPAAKPAAKSNPAVLKQQQELIAKGAKIKADGVMGPATQAAIKQFAAAPAASRSAAPAAPSAGAGRGFVNPTAPATTAAKPAVAPAKPAAKPAAPVKPAVKESQEISRMRFLAGLSKD